MNSLKTVGLILVWMTFLTPSDGQDLYNDLIFLKRDSNVFFFAKGNVLYDSLFRKFNRLQIEGNKQIRILHVGDSHVQADIFTNQIRRDFAHTFFNLIGPPAIAFPYSILKSNNPVATSVICNGNWSGYNVVQKSQNNSLLGLTAYTNDTCPSKIIVSVNTLALQNVNFNKLLVFCNADTEHVFLKPALESVHTVHAFNDTIFCHEFNMNCYTDSVTLFFKSHSDTSFFKLYAIVPCNDDPDIVYQTIGVNGAKAASFNNTLLSSFIKYMHYDWVIISLGTNDCYLPKFDSTVVSNSFYALISSIQQENPNTPLLLTTPMEHYLKRKALNPNVVRVKNIIFDVAEKKHTAVWDLFTVSGGYEGMPEWCRSRLTAYDKLHLNTDGYHLVGDLFFDAFLNTYLNGFLSP